MVHRLFAVLLSVLLALSGGAAAAWPAMEGWSLGSEAERSTQQGAGMSPQSTVTPQDVADLLAADDPQGFVGTNDDWSPSAAAEPLADVSALPPLPQRCFSSGMRGATPARPVMALYQPPDLAGPQRPPCGQVG